MITGNILPLWSCVESTYRGYLNPSEGDKKVPPKIMKAKVDDRRFIGIHVQSSRISAVLRDIEKFKKKEIDDAKKEANAAKAAKEAARGQQEVNAAHALQAPGVKQGKVLDVKQEKVLDFKKKI